MVDSMIDKRKLFRMESGYCGSDFSFYKKFEETADADMYTVLKFQSEAGNNNWYLVSSYTHYWKSGYGQDAVLVLVNDKGVQIETCQFGWYRVPTEHELALKEKKEYHAFIDALAALKTPNGLSRWHSEIIELFEHTYEEILYYGDDDAN